MPKPIRFFYQPGCGPTALAPYGPEKLVILCHLANRLIITDRGGRKLSEINKAAGNEAIFRPNDCTVDEAGGVYITAPGHFAKKFQPMGKLFYLSPHGKVHKLSENLTYPNGIAIHNDRLYVSEHLANRVLYYEMKSPGKLGRAKVFAKLDPSALQQGETQDQMRHLIGPDGIEISKKGEVYTAHYGRGRILVFNQQGQPMRTIRTRVPFTTNMALSPDGNHLIITGARNLTPPLQQGVVYRLELHQPQP